MREIVGRRFRFPSASSAAFNATCFLVNCFNAYEASCETCNFLNFIIQSLPLYFFGGHWRWKRAALSERVGCNIPTIVQITLTWVVNLFSVNKRKTFGNNTRPKSLSLRSTIVDLWSAKVTKPVWPVRRLYVVKVSFEGGVNKKESL